MSLLFRVLHANKCTSTHHKLAMDALQQLESVHAAQWQNLFIKNIELYLDGAKAPDKKFKDFRNHVLHVQDNYWGGAVVKAEEWYQRLCECLRQEDWARSVYAAGVLSHYITDPFMPLHTAQSEAEGAVHRAAEWSVTKSYDSLVESLTDELGGYPSMSLSPNDDWLALAIIAGAQQANQHYETLIDHYNLEAGVKNPPEGLDQECRDLIAKLLGSATVTLARIYDRAFDVASVTPPETSVTLAGYLTTLTTPVFWVTKKLADNKDKEAVRAIYREVQMKNRAIESLPEDERTVRTMHAEEVLGITEEELEKDEPRQTGTKFGTGTPSRRPTSQVASTVDDETAETEPTGESTMKNTPTKFGQSAWRERRRERREAAAAAVQSVADEAMEDATGTAELAVAETTAPEVVNDGAPKSGMLPRVAAAATAMAAAIARRRATVGESEDVGDETDDPIVDESNRPADAASEQMPDIDESPEAESDYEDEEPESDDLAATAESSDTHPESDDEYESDEYESDEDDEEEPDEDGEAAEYEEDEYEDDQYEDDEEESDENVEAAEYEEDESEDEESDDGYEEDSDEYEDDESEDEDEDEDEEESDENKEAAEYEEDEDAGEDESEDAEEEEIVEEEQEEAEEPVVFQRIQREERGPRFHLELDSPVVDAPSIGGGTAKRLRKVGIRTVGDLLECDPDLTAVAIRASYITAESLTQWQNQSRLQCRVPGLRGHDAQILVACGLTDPTAIARMTADELLAIVGPFSKSSDGERILRSSSPPDRDEITNWIEWSGLSRSLRAA